MRSVWKKIAVCGAAVAISASAFASTLAVPPPGWHFDFYYTYNRTDLPVEEGKTNRTWVWGDEIDTRQERYDSIDLSDYGNIDEPGIRTVRYYDKARMEWNPEKREPWNVTTGLLATELITGQMQLGDETLEEHEPAEVPVAGDPDSEITPTYADMQALMDEEPMDSGELVTATLDAEGNVGVNEAYAEYDVTAATIFPETNHRIATVFWEFMNSVGTIWLEQERIDGELKNIYGEYYLFENPVYVTGLPITEPYWSKAKVAGEEKDVLLQCFQRRCLTYTPDNSEGWKIEMANIGQHYYFWRYDSRPWEE